MHSVHSRQYGTPCVIPSPEDGALTVIDHCREIGAVLYDDGEEFCVQLRADIGPELWTERALQRSGMGTD